MSGDHREFGEHRAHVLGDSSACQIPSGQSCHRWLSAYPDGVPATVDIRRHPNVVTILDESFKRHPN